jgi:hypothetical protein
MKKKLVYSVPQLHLIIDDVKAQCAMGTAASIDASCDVGGKASSGVGWRCASGDSAVATGVDGAGCNSNGSHAFADASRISCMANGTVAGSTSGGGTCVGTGGGIATNGACVSGAGVVF